jgi:hypothetical protein
MSSKLRIRIGEVEIDYEGTEEFLKQELPQLLKTAMELHKASGASVSSGVVATQSKSSAVGSSSAVPSLTTGSIAAKLGAKTGTDLLTAAAAHLALVKKTEPFSRQVLLAEMKSATSYYKANYSGNLSKLLKTALQKGGVLSETAKNAYAMTASSRANLEAKLAHG